MGSFNTSCFATRQTIASGDACMVIAIAQKSTYQPVELEYRGEKSSALGVCNSVCYPTRFWGPVSTFIEAQYDDYGRVSLADSKSNRSALLQFIGDALRLTPKVFQGENPSHEVPYDLAEFMQGKTPGLFALLTAKGPEPVPPIDGQTLFSQLSMCWDYLWEVANEQRLFWRDYKGNLRPMQFSLMHRAAFDALVARAEAGTNWNDESLAMRAHFERSVDKALASLEESEASAADNQDPEQQRMHSRMRTYLLSERLRTELARVGDGEGSTYPGEHAALSEQRALLQAEELDRDTLFENLKPWLKTRYAYASLSGLNLHFEPMVYAGQDYSNDIGRAFAQFVQDVSRTVTRGRQEHYAGSPFTGYRVSVTDPAVFKAMSKACREWDNAMDLVRVVPLGADAGHVLEFDSTMTASLLAEFLAEFASEDPRVLPQTLEPMSSGQ